jgi:hypothetical protein
MQQIKVKSLTEHKKEIIYINPKCGHTQKADYSLPFRCQEVNCTEEVTQVDKLFGERNQDSRVKFYVEGKL